uniref:Uncharacterized protein n=1 Tax=Arundo donax TaxID=35708 RepID=A0A0A9C662_ARUDO
MPPEYGYIKELHVNITVEKSPKKAMRI